MDQQINVLSEFMKRMKHLYDAAHPNGAPEGLYARLIHEEYKECLLKEKEHLIILKNSVILSGYVL